MEALSGRSLKLKDTVDMGRDAGTEPRARSFQAFFLSNHCLTISPGCDVPITNQAFGRSSVIDQSIVLPAIGGVCGGKRPRSDGVGRGRDDCLGPLELLPYVGSLAFSLHLLDTQIWRGECLVSHSVKGAVNLVVELALSCCCR